MPAPCAASLIAPETLLSVWNWLMMGLPWFDFIPWMLPFLESS